MKNKTKWQELTEKGINAVFMLCGIVAVGFVLCITVHLVIAGLPAIMKIGLPTFLFGTTWQPTATTTEPSFGILPFILTSIYGTAGAVLIGVPIGLLTAIFLAKAAPPKFAKVIHTAVELLAAGRLTRKNVSISVAPNAIEASSYSLGPARSAVSDTLMMDGKIIMVSTIMAANNVAPEGKSKAL